MQVQVFIMSFYSNKEKMEGNDYKDICRNHSAKADREMYRVCPSKLSKKELEDLYFTLLENNLELKKTINGQQDKIRILSTQVQRMTNTQERLVSKETKDRGTATKAIVDEQKDFISELKETNQGLADRIQQLNMKLCSAKQFLKTSRPQSVPYRANRSAATAVSTPKKHDCLNKGAESPERVLKVSTYSQWEEKTPSSSKTPRNTSQTPNGSPIDKRPLKSDQPCDENKCRTLMEELKLKIAGLQDELVTVHGEYATRIGRLETEVIEVRKENIRVISERSASETELTDTYKRAADMLARYRNFEAKYSELATELAIEKRKVAELETRLKAANMSDKVNRTIEDHLTTKQEKSGPRNGGPRDGDPRDGGSRDGSPRARKPRDGKPKDGSPRDGEPKDVGPRVASPEDDGPRDGGRQDSASQEGSSKNNSTRKCICGCLSATPTTPPPPPLGVVVNNDVFIQEKSEKPDSGPRGGDSQVGNAPIGSPRVGSPLVGGPRDGKPKDGSPRDGEPKDGSPRVESPKDGSPRVASPEDDGPRDGGPQEGSSKNDSTRKCICGCPPPTPPTPSPPPLRVVNEKAPVKTLPSILPHKKRDGLDDASVKSSPTKYSLMNSSNGSKCNSSCGSYATTATSEDTNCETCGCKDQLMSAVSSPAQAVHYFPIPCSIVNGKCSLCGYTPPENTSTPIKDKKKNVECRCPVWVQDGLLEVSSSQDAKSKCMKCCFKDELESTGSTPPKTDEGLPPRGGATSVKGDLNSTSTNTDSGYQDTDEQGLLKQNKELMAKILELQRQIDCMKIGGFCGMPGDLGETGRSPAKTADNSVVTAVTPLLGELPKDSELPKDEPAKPNPPDAKDTAPIPSPPLLTTPELPQAEILLEKTEQSLKDKNYDWLESVPSDDHENIPRGKLRIEVLGNPGETTTALPVQGRLSDDTRAKTIEDADGTQIITDDPLPVPDTSTHDTYGYPDVTKNDNRDRDSWDSPKFEIVEKKKHEDIAPRKPDPRDITLKSATSIGPGPGFNPEKLKYLEAEGLTAEMSSIKDESLTESIPSNPELGFAIPRLASKASQGKNKAQTGSGLLRKSLGTSNPTSQPENAMLRTPARETLLASHPSAPTQTDDTNKVAEDCQYCTACSFDKECAHAIKPIMNKLALGMQKEHAKKHDQNNRYQILGPKQPSDTGKKEKRRNLLSHFRKQKSTTGEDMIVNAKVYARATSETAGGPVNLPDVPLLEKRDHSLNDYRFVKASEIDQKTFNNDKKDKSRKRKKGGQTKDNLIMNPRVFAQETCDRADGPVNLADVPLLQMTGEEKSKNGPGKDLQNLPEKSTQASSFKAWQGDVSLFRRQSGTYCFRRELLDQGPLVCRCAGQQDGACSLKPKNKDTPVVDNQENLSPREKRRAALTSDRGTYTLESKTTETSPDNTDLEMSYLPDLPMEKDKKSPLKSRPLSPGEDKTTTYTSTYSGTSPLTDYSLSEGEMPAPLAKRKHSEPDGGRLYVNPTLANKVETPPAQQMEAALQAVTEELRRCTNLLHRHRSSELAQQAPRSSCNAVTSATSAARPLALKAGAATQGIGDAQAPRSVFTLHIGTVVLSDVAVLSSRDKDLVLKWKFYDQAVTMARLRACRVMVFDFSTEYDIKITEDFLNYMKYEQMPIVMCVLDREEQTFASCGLPLRDALLHTNARADMSLALVAGPQMLIDRTTNGIKDSLGSREVGVIDLWCMLRAESITVPGINLAIAQPGEAMTTQERQSGVMLQGTDDYNALELDMLHSGPAATHEQTGKNQTYADVGYTRPSDTWNNQPRTRPTKDSGGTQPVSVATARESTYDPSKYPPLRQRNSSQVSPEQPSEKSRVSEMIMNEVKPMIKTPRDVKFALQRSTRLNDPKCRIGRTSEQEVLSQAHGSYSSLRNALSRIQKKGSRQTQTQGGDQRNFIEKLRKASPTRAELSKKVAIQPEYFESAIEEPQRDIIEEPTANEHQLRTTPKLEITVLWLALNEECEAMIDPHVQRVYVAYTFLGRPDAELETPVSLPKPKHCVEKCYFNFKKVFELEDADFPKLGHMAQCRNGSGKTNETDCIIFSVVSEPAEDPLGIESCEDIGYAYLYLGDLLAYSAGSPGYTEVIPVRAARGAAAVCGVLAVRLDGLDVVRRCLVMTTTEKAARHT